MQLEKPGECERSCRHDYVADSDVDVSSEQQVDCDEQQPGDRNVGTDNRRDAENGDADGFLLPDRALGLRRMLFLSSTKRPGVCRRVSRHQSVG